MVFELIGAPGHAATIDPLPAQAPSLVDMPDRETPPPASRSLPAGVISQLLRSAVALQAEGLLRTAGALAGSWGGVLDRTEWIERDARDLSDLASAAACAGVPLPAGVDSGAGDPQHPSSVVEGMLASHQALVSVLRQLAGDARPEGAPAGGDSEEEPWRRVVRGVLARREQEMVLLRAVGAAGRLPGEEAYVHGSPPRG